MKLNPTNKQPMTFKQKFGVYLYRWLPLSRRSINIIRYELACWVQRLVNMANLGYQLRIRKIRKQKNLMINLGSGGKGKHGWINTDMASHTADDGLALDIRKKLPFSDESARYIMVEHVIEHLDVFDDVPALLRECYRVLAPGGVLRLVVPDCERYCAAYALGTRSSFLELGWDLDAMPSDIHTKMHILNHQFHQGGEHMFGWDFETMSFFLGRSGFNQVTKMSYGKSIIQTGAIDQANHRLYSLYVDAVK